MLKTSHCLRTLSNITEIKKNTTNTIAIGTQYHGIKIYNYLTCEESQVVKNEYLNKDTSAISFSPNGEFAVFYTKPYLHVLHIMSQIVLKTIKIEEEIVEHLEFDLESKYIIAATQNARVLQYRYDGSSLIGRLYSFEQVKNAQTHKASSFAFYKNIMACGGTNGAVFCINLHSRANKIILQNNRYQISSLCFVGENHLISADVKGDLYLNSLKNNALLVKQETLFTEINHISLTPDEKYLMVCGNENYVAVYDAKTLKLLHSKYIEFEANPIKIIAVDEDTLVAVLENYLVEKVRLQNADRLEALVVNQMYDKAYHLVQQNPLLKDTKEYRNLEATYEKIYDLAIKALEQNNKEGALRLTNIFKYTGEKQSEIELLYKSFDNFSRFKTLYSEKKFALAYAMSNKFPALKKTAQFLKMEEIWEEVFLNAKRQMKLEQSDHAATLLNEFSTIIEKRPMIKLVLNHFSDYELFLKAIKIKNFKIIAKMSKENLLLKELKEYQDIAEEMQKSLRKIQSDIHKCELESALKELSKLQNIDSISQEVALQKDELKALKKLQDAYDENDFNLCYELIDAYNTLNATQLGILLQKHWLKVISQCETYALKGSVRDIKETLGELVYLKSRTDKIGDLFRLAFHTKIKALIHKKSYKQAEAIIYSYIDIFGPDNELRHIMKTYEKGSKERLAITINSRYDRDKWLNSSMIMEQD